jgi:hypothetical protein
MNDTLNKIVNHPLRTPVISGVVAFGVGLGIGYILGKRQTFDDIEIEIDTEVDVEEYFDVTGLTLENDDVVEESDDIVDVTDSVQETRVIVDLDKLKALNIQRSIEKHQAESVPEEDPEFAGEDDDWNWEEENQSRSENVPYILHKDEFWAEEKGYSQLTLTYYAGDNILTDEEDTPIYNHEEVTGPMRFGHGAQEPNVFYVRNDKRHAEYEILLNEGLYSVEVLGIEIEDNHRARDLKHSNNRKFRMD